MGKKGGEKRGASEVHKSSSFGRKTVSRGNTSGSSLLVAGGSGLVLAAVGVLARQSASSDSRSTIPLQTLLEPLKRGECAFGNLSEPGTIPSVSLTDLGDFRLPGGLRCPLLIHGLAEGLKPGAWESIASLGDPAELEKHALSKIEFDASSTGLFAYWDNASLLAKAALQAGHVRQSYMKMKMPRSTFFEAARRSAASELGFVRYGGPVRNLAPSIESKLAGALAPLSPQGESNAKRSFWVSSAGSFSTAHYDSFENSYVMISGEKLAVLAPPADAPFFEVYGGTHPLARQARRHFGNSGADHLTSKSGQDLLPTGARVLQTNIKAGCLLFIPAGWFHHLVALQLSVSAALTVLPHEHTVFNSWVASGNSHVLPFLAEGTGSWSTPRLVSTLRVFAPALLAALPSVTALGDPLKLFVTASYSKHVHAELGLPRTRFRCGKPPSAEDARLARESASVIAQHFLKHFREDLQLSYVLAYFETVFSKVAGTDAQGVPEIMSRTAAFVQQCLIDKPLI